MAEKEFTSKAMHFKEDDSGQVLAVFATLDVIDGDGDVTVPGAFGEQEVRLAAWSHNWGSLPPGRGRISEKGEEALFEGQFFLDTDTGLQHYRTVKNLGDLQEWSYGFKIIKSSEGERDSRPVRFLEELKVHEVSPVMVGVGVATRTLAIKSDGKMVLPPHAGPKADEATVWARPGLGDFTSDSWEELSAAEQRQIARHFVWAVKMPPERFGDLKGPHHRPSDGAVVWRGVVALAARMNQLDIPDGDLPAVRRHLGRHYEQFDKTPPWETRGWSHADQAEHMLANVQALTERTQSLTELRAKEGRGLSPAAYDRLGQLVAEIKVAQEAMAGLLVVVKAPDLRVEFVRYQRTLARLAGVGRIQK